MSRPEAESTIAALMRSDLCRYYSLRCFFKSTELSTLKASQLLALSNS